VERRAALATVAPDGGPGCLVTFDGKLELWRMASGGGVLRRDTLCAEGERARKEGTNPRRAPERSDPLGCATKRLLSSPGGCVTLAGGVVRLHSPTGPRTLVARDAVAVSVEQEAILVATTSQLLALGRSGARRRTFTVPPGVTAVGRAGRWIVVGYREGNMDLLDARTGRPRRGFLFERVPSSQAERIAAGPRGTLVAGYANGLVGLWDLQRGTRLDTRKLHGPVSHLVHDGQKLHVASELGGHLVWDLAALHLDYCELLRDVWRRVPVAWRDGLPVLAPAPTGHRCRRGSAR